MFKVKDIFLMFKQPKHCIKMAALMLLLPTGATIEEKWTCVWTNAIPHTTEDHKLFQHFGFMHQDTS